MIGASGRHLNNAGPFLGDLPRLKPELDARRDLLTDLVRSTHPRCRPDARKSTLAQTTTLSAVTITTVKKERKEKARLVTARNAIREKESRVRYDANGTPTTRQLSEQLGCSNRMLGKLLIRALGTLYERMNPVACRAPWIRCSRGDAGVGTCYFGSLYSSLHLPCSLLFPPEAIRRTIIRHLILVLDLSASMLDRDMRPTRFDLMLEYARAFILEWFDQNPLGQIGVVGMRAGIAERIGDMSGAKSYRLRFNCMR